MGNNEGKKPPINIFKITKDQWPFILKLLIIAFFGIVILNFASIFYTPSNGSGGSGGSGWLGGSDNSGGGIVQDQLQEESSYVPDEVTLEKRLEKILSQMDGVGNTSVSILYAEGPTREYAVNVSTTAKEIQEKDQSGGVRTTNEKTENGQMVMIEGNLQPVLVKESMPKIQGVLIVAEGVEDPLVKEKLFKAVQTLLQVPAHRITICPRNGG